MIPDELEENTASASIGAPFNHDEMMRYNCVSLAVEVHGKGVIASAPPADLIIETASKLYAFIHSNCVIVSQPSERQVS